ncbi:MAG: DUF72 domain-containing protein [Saprospiraceae bacterium]|nr:DUF72 domain-containing protein [Saprospiraceae bacterium]
MKFGHATAEEIGDVSFSLPQEHPLSISHKPNPDKFSIRVGCGKWGIPTWIGTLYPEGTKQKNFLEAYIAHFNSIELNGTFYRLSRTSIDKWASAAEGADFLFCPKWSQRISHFKRLNEVEENVQYFMDSMALLGENLGATFLTLPPNFGPKHEERVNSFLDLIPDGYPFQIEFRHKDWFEEAVFARVMEKLRDKRFGAVITDVALRRDVLHMCRTSQTVFIRFNGYGLDESDYERLDKWVSRLADWRQLGVHQVFFFMHQANEEHTIVLCDYFIKQVNAKLDQQIKPLNLSKK